MKIVFSSSSRGWGGIHTITATLAHGLISRGHEIVIFAAAGSLLASNMRAVAAVEPIAGGMDMSPLGIARALRAFRHHNVDVALGITKKDVRITGPAARMCGVPFVLRHPNDQPIPQSPYHKLLYKHCVQHHITNAQSTKQTLLDSAPWLGDADVSVIYNGLDVDKFANAQPATLPVPPDACTIAFIGAFERRKGLDDLADAWPAVARAAPHAHLLMVGDGALAEHMRARMADAPRVRWLGRRTDIPHIMNAIDVLVLPSLVEGAPNVVQEAMAAGKPVVATAVSGTPELIDDGASGLLVPPRSPEKLATALIALANDQQRRADMGRKAAQIAQRRFRADRMIDQYESLLSDITRRYKG